MQCAEPTNNIGDREVVWNTQCEDPVDQEKAKGEIIYNHHDKE